MNASQNNKLRAYLAVSAVLEKYKTVWQALVGFNKAVVEFDALLPEITDLVRIQSSRSGATTEKGAALEALGNSAPLVAATSWWPRTESLIRWKITASCRPS